MKTIVRMEGIKHSFFTLFHHHMMKNASLLLIGLMISVMGSVLYAQDARISIQAHNMPVREVLKMIESKSDYHFAYNNKLIDVTRTVSVNATNEKISDILKQIFEGTDVTTSVVDHQIVLASSKSMGGAVKQENVRKITGKVTDEKGQALPGATVMIKGTTQGTITDAKGAYSLQRVSSNETLVYSFVGMQSREVNVGNQDVINISLSEKAIGLNEVVAIGYGTMRKKDVTGAVSFVTSKTFDSQSTANMGDALEGQLAGVQISRPSGQPQAGYDIIIRGISTITAGSNPLFIVDGVPTTSINQIDPTDIESISVLKDASAAAIYGVSGANGVILITTKHGGNNGIKVSFNSYYGIANVSKKMDVLNVAQYKDLMTEMGYNTNWALYNNNTNWQDQVFRTGQTQNYQLSVSGGDNKTNFYLSGSYFNQGGIIIANSMERYSFRGNVDYKVSDFFKVGSNVSYNKWFDVNLPEGGRWSMENSFLTASPVIGIYNTDGTFTSDPFIQDLENPVALLTENQHGYNNYRFNGNAYAELSFTKDLKFKSMFGVEENNSSYHSWIDPLRSRQGRNYNGIADYSNSLSFYWISENTLNYDKKIGKNAFGALAGFVASKINGESSEITGKNFGSGAVHTVNAGTQIGATYSEFAKSNESFLSRINYAYDNKYLLTANFRADGSSVFGAAHKWGYFPSFSTGWRISKERFWNENSFVNDLKIRVGWGQVGNDQIGNYASWGVVAPNANYVIGGSQVPGTAITQMENSDLHWEKTAQTDIGLDAYLFNSRIAFTADYYMKNTTDMLLDAPIPMSVGMGWRTSITTENIGSMTNKGLEFQVSSKNLTGLLKWTTDFNISFNRNKITKLAYGVPILGGFIDNRSACAIAEVGKPLGMFYGYVAEGVDPATGNIKYKDLDHSGDLSDGDKTIIGNANPKFTYGLTNSFEYKGFTFSFFFQGVQGNQIFNASRIVTEGMYYPINQMATVLNRWEKPGDITTMPKSDRDNANHNSDVSSRYVEDGSYLRLKSATLGYDLPKSISKFLKIEKFHIYVTAENLLTFTKYSGYDPEVSAYGVGIAPGVDFGSYPESRSFMFGLNINF